MSTLVENLVLKVTCLWPSRHQLTQNGKTTNRTFAQGAANGSSEPIFPDAACCTKERKVPIAVFQF